MQAAGGGSDLGDETDVCGERLHSVETGDQSHRQKALLIHLLAQEEIPLQVVHAEVVFTAETNTPSQHEEETLHNSWF